MTKQSIPVVLATTLPAPDTFYAALFAMLAADGLPRFNLARLAAQHHWPLAALRQAYPTIGHSLAGFSMMITAEMQDSVRPDPHATPRDVLFEALMARLDALQPYRAGFIRLLRDLPGRPDLALIMLRQTTSMVQALYLMLPVSLPLWRLPLFQMAAAGFYARLLHVWQQDNSPDLTKTMAFLDQQLDTLIRFLPQAGTEPDAP